MVGFGIDLGTAYARAAVFNVVRPVLVQDSGGNDAIPAVVCFDGGIHVGRAALARAALCPDKTVHGIKR